MNNAGYFLKRKTYKGGVGLEQTWKKCLLHEVGQPAVPILVLHCMSRRLSTMGGSAHCKVVQQTLQQTCTLQQEYWAGKCVMHWGL